MPLSVEDVELLEELSPAQRVGITVTHRDLRDALGVIAKRAGSELELRGDDDQWKATMNDDGAEIAINGELAAGEDAWDIEWGREATVHALAVELARRCGPMILCCNDACELVLPPDESASSTAQRTAKPLETDKTTKAKKTPVRSRR